MVAAGKNSPSGIRDGGGEAGIGDGWTEVERLRRAYCFEASNLGVVGSSAEDFASRRPHWNFNGWDYCGCENLVVS